MFEKKGIKKPYFLAIVNESIKENSFILLNKDKNARNKDISDSPTIVLIYFFRCLFTMSEISLRAREKIAAISRTHEFSGIARF